MAKNKADESTDACPFPPDGDPPPKTPTTNIIEHVESFFEGWRNYFAVLTLASLVLAYSLLAVPPPLITEAPIPDTWSMQYEPNGRPLDRFKWIKVSDPEQNHTGQMILDGDEAIREDFLCRTWSEYFDFKPVSKIYLREAIGA